MELDIIRKRPIWSSYLAVVAVAHDRFPIAYTSGSMLCRLLFVPIRCDIHMALANLGDFPTLVQNEAGGKCLQSFAACNVQSAFLLFLPRSIDTEYPIVLPPISVFSTNPTTRAHSFDPNTQIRTSVNTIAATAAMVSNTWTMEQRQVLFLLHTQFTLSSHDIATIFNEVFVGHLSNHGIVGGLTASILGSQWRDRERANRAQAWIAALDSLTADQILTTRLLTYIRTAASRTGVPLPATSNTTSDTSASALPAASDARSFDASNQPSTTVLTPNSLPSSWKGWIPATDGDLQRQEDIRRQNGFNVGVPFASRTRAGERRGAAEGSNPGSKSTSTDDKLVNIGYDTPGDDQDQEHDVELQQNVNYSEYEGDTPESMDVDLYNIQQARSVPEGQLDMIHDSHVTWLNNHGTVPSWHRAWVDPEGNGANVYKHGGQVHRITCSETEAGVDVMICDPSHCLMCCDEDDLKVYQDEWYVGDINDVDAGMENMTDRLPYVHSTDVIRSAMSPHTFFFSPHPKPNRQVRPGSDRRIVFQTEEGAKSVAVTVCKMVECETCLAHIEAQRPRDEENEESRRED